MTGLINRILSFNQNIKQIFVINTISSAVMIGVYNVFTGIHIKNLGYGESVVGYVLSISSMSIAVGAMINAYLNSRLGIKKTLVMGISLMLAGMLGVAFAVDKSWLFFFSAMTGMGYGFPLTSIGVLLAENSSSEERVSVFSTNFIIQSLGLVSSSYIAGKFIGIFGSVFSSEKAIPVLYLFCSTLVLFTLLPIRNLEDVDIASKKKSKGFVNSFKEVAKGKSLNFLIYNIAIGLGAGMVIPFFSVYLKYALNIDNEQIGTIMGLSQLGLVLGGLLVPYLSKALGSENTVILCQLLSIPFLVSIAFPQGLGIVAVSFLMRSTLMNLNQPLIQSISMESVDPENRSVMSSLVSMSSNVTRAVSMIIAGYLMEHVSYNFPYYFTVVLYMSGTYIFYKTFKRKI